MNIKSLYPSVNVNSVFMDLRDKGEVGRYEPTPDVIIVCESLKHDLPICRDIVYIHELMHATGNKTRSLRRQRLLDNFGTKCYRVEECIAEAATMVVLSKLGVLNKYSTTIPEAGIKKYYKPDIYIPWREVVSAVNCFKGEDVDFTDSLIMVKQYLKAELNISIKDLYERTSNKTAV